MPFLAAIPAAIGGALGATGAGAAAFGTSVLGAGLSTIGGLFNQSAANKGPQPIFPGQQQQYMNLVSPLASAGAGTLTSMAKTGNPTNVGPAWDALVAASQRQTTQGYDKLLGSFGAAGSRYSSTAMNGAQDYLTQSNANFLQILANYTMQAQESAAQRSLQASEFGVQALQGPALAMKGPQGSLVGAGLQGAGGDLQTIALLQMLGLGKNNTNSTLQV